MVDKCASSLYRIYLFFYSKNPFELGCKSTKNFLYSNTFLEKIEKGKTKIDFAFFKLLKISCLCNYFFFGDVLQRFDEEVPERLHALDEQGLVG